MSTQTITNFCSSCKKKSKSLLYCTTCGGGLISEPELEFHEYEPVIGMMASRESNLKVAEPTTEELYEELKEIVHEPAIVEERKPEPYIVTNSNRFHFLTGAGGTGKTFLIRQRAADNPRYIALASTTGIAAVNLGGRTINSVLGYFDTKSLRKSWEEGRLQYKLRMVRQNKEVLGIEECSMLPAEQLDLIVNAVDEINNDRSGKQLGVHLIGDFAQLPPVSTDREKSEFCFKADCWPRFEASVEKLTKIWRQDNPDFIKAINFARVGDGNSAVTWLLDCGVRFEDKIDNWFEGTSLIAVNNEVDFYNTRRLNQLNTPMIRTMSVISGTPLAEWKKLIPLELRVKENAYVMILSNDIPNFNYVNGDTGWIRGYDSKKDSFQVELKRTGVCVTIKRIKRLNLTDRAPNSEYFKPGFSPYVDQMSGDWVVGEISYHPLRLAYASTVHKCLIPESRILTTKGIKKLQDVLVGEEIINPYGGYSKVLDKQFTIRPLVTIKTDFGHIVHCSPEHKFPVYNKEGNCLGFTEASDLSIGDRLRVSKRSFIGEDLELSTDFAWLLGILIGDGSYRDRRDGTVEICSIDNEIHDLAEAVLNRFNIKLHRRKNKRGSYFISKQLRRQLLQDYGLGYTLAENKCAPEIIFRSNELVRGAFLRGLFDADSHINKHTITLTSTSKQLIIDTQLLLGTLGIISTWSEQKQKYNGSPYIYWQLRIPRHYHEHFKRKIGFVVDYKKQTLEKQKLPNQNCLEKFRLGLTKIKSITTNEIQVPMIDIEVSDNHLFVSDGIVTHNSQGLSLDLVQIDTNAWFIGNPNMLYVALSRARTPSGLVIVGKPQDVAKKIVVHPDVGKWI